VNIEDLQNFLLKELLLHQVTDNGEYKLMMLFA